MVKYLWSHNTCRMEGKDILFFFFIFIYTNLLASLYSFLASETILDNFAFCKQYFDLFDIVFGQSWIRATIQLLQLLQYFLFVLLSSIIEYVLLKEGYNFFLMPPVFFDTHKVSEVVGGHLVLYLLADLFYLPVLNGLPLGQPAEISWTYPV
jgi:hypothetical protein